MLADFRAWLSALSIPPSQPSPAKGEGGGEGREAIDLHTLLGQFLAVRQEVNLQTRAVRAQQEQNAETLRQLTEALDVLRRRQDQDEQMQQQAIDDAIRPLLRTLIELYDALALAGREMRRLRETVLPSLEQLAAATSIVPEKARFLLSRLFHASIATPEQQERERSARESAERIHQLLTSLVTGYTMSLQRIERALKQQGLEPIGAAGERFDPERMEVVEAVSNSGRPSGEVVEEVRRGYLRKGRVFRYAQVRVAKE